MYGWMEFVQDQKTFTLLTIEAYRFGTAGVVSRRMNRKAGTARE
jgi:hypothetical protein